MNQHIYWEIFGYIGTALIILSMTMSSVVKLRIINICGSVISTAYAIHTQTRPIVVMNVCLMAINAFHVIRALRQSKTPAPADMTTSPSAE